MADANSAPRRVSLAYMLGFSNKPFKDGGPPALPPPPRHPNAFKQMVTTPGGVIEWAASDGRRGRLTGPGKQRVTATNPAQVSAKASASKKAASDEGGMFSLFDDAKGDKSAKSSGDWTKEQDEKLLELKAADLNGPWEMIAKEVGKNPSECKARFKQIKPKDWKPSDAKGGNGQKQNKQKGEKNQKEDKKKEKAKEDFKPDSNDNVWGGAGNNDGWDQPNGANNGAGAWNGKDNTQSNNGGGNTGGDGFNLGGTTGTDTNNCAWENTGNTSSNNGGGNTGGEFNFEGTAGTSTNNCAWNDNDNTWNKEGGGNTGGEFNFDNDTGNTGGGVSGGDVVDQWATNPGNANNEFPTTFPPAPPASPPSNKHPNPASKKTSTRSVSKHHSRREPHKPTSAPTEYELKPDSTFSADDLRLVARILQQDCQMVWNRVSWRFRDKTGRNLGPGVFEEKITGKVERGRY